MPPGLLLRSRWGLESPVGVKTGVSLRLQHRAFKGSGDV